MEWSYFWKKWYLMINPVFYNSIKNRLSYVTLQRNHSYQLTSLHTTWKLMCTLHIKEYYILRYLYEKYNISSDIIMFDSNVLFDISLTIIENDCWWRVESRQCLKISSYLVLNNKPILSNKDIYIIYVNCNGHMH